MGDDMAEDKTERRHLPKWAKRLLLAISIVGPLTGAVVTATDAYYNVKSKANTAKAQTKASYETLAPAIKELQDLLTKTQELAEAQERALVELRAAKLDSEKRILRLEAYVDIIGRNRSLPSPPPEVKSVEQPAATNVVKAKPERPIPVNIGIAKQYQDVRAKLKCSANDPSCDMAAAASVDSMDGPLRSF